MTDTTLAFCLLDQLELLNELQLRQPAGRATHQTKARPVLGSECHRARRGAERRFGAAAIGGGVEPSPIAPLARRRERGWGEGDFTHRNFILEGDNFDTLRLLKAIHTGKIRVINIDGRRAN